MDYNISLDSNDVELIIHALEVMCDNLEADRKSSSDVAFKSECMNAIKVSKQMIIRFKNKDGNAIDLIRAYPALVDYRDDIVNSLPMAPDNIRDKMLEMRSRLNRLIKRIKPIAEKAISQLPE